MGAVVVHQKSSSLNVPFVFKSFPAILWRIGTAGRGEDGSVLRTSLREACGRYDCSTPADEEAENQRRPRAESHKAGHVLRHCVPGLWLFLVSEEVPHPPSLRRKNTCLALGPPAPALGAAAEGPWARLVCGEYFAHNGLLSQGGVTVC